MSLIDELKRRNVFRVGIAYLIIAWLLAQVADLFLENFGAPEWVIKTVLLMLVIGFPLAIFFAWAFEMTPEGIKRERDVDRENSITAHTGRKLDRAIIGVLVIALGYFVFDKFARTDLATEAVSTAETAADVDPLVVATPAKSIAVLPFVNMSSDAEQEYFSDGISEEILNALAGVKDLKVAGRTSSFAFKGQNQDLRMIGETLGVTHILEGSVRKAGDKVRITAQLIKVDDGFHMWSDTYDRELTDVFAIQDEIANAILQQMKAALLDNQSIASTQTDPLAYDLYLLAKQKTRDRNEQSLENAKALLNQAIKADPGFAPAYAQMGIAHLHLNKGDYGSVPITEARENAKPWLDRAIELDPNLAEAWAGLGLYWVNSQVGIERAEAREPLEKALEINPNLIDASNWLQNSLIQQGLLREAVAILENMHQTDPLYRPGIGNLVARYSFMGEFEKARAVLERARPFFPNDTIIADNESVILGLEGRHGEALPLSRAAWLAQPNDWGNRLVYALRLSSLRQFEEILELNGNELRVAALNQLGRTEEASILAFELAASGEDIGSVIHLLGRSGQHEELVEFVDSRWPDLEAWQADFPSRFGLGDMQLALISQAYRSTGNDAKFTDGMQRLEVNLAHQRAQGADNFVLLESEAYFHMLAGNEQAALDKLGEAIDRGLTMNPRIAEALPAFRPLEGDPRFEDIQQRMIAHLNSERAKLDLEPIELDRTL